MVTRRRILGLSGMAAGMAVPVPGTPVTMTIGLAELDSHTGMDAAFQAADLLMLQRKHSQDCDGRERA